jgi:hypothetical protein
MDDKFSTFVMSETTLRQIKVLPPELQLKFFWAVTSYGIDGIEPDFTGLELAIWIPMRDLIFHTKRKDEEWRRKQQENGKKGGRPKTQDNPTEPKKPTETQDNPDDIWVNLETHNDNDNDNDNKKDKEKGGFCFSPPEDFQESQEAPDLPDKFSDPLPDKPSETKEDATRVFLKARELWNERNLPPECRELIIPPAQYDCLAVFQNYSWPEIENAIKNYHWHKTGNCGEGWIRAPPYGSIFGFLKTGVARYFDDDAFELQFKEEG